MTNKKSFTMTELIVVMVIISLIAAFGIPSFVKATIRAKARDAINNLIVLHAAQAIYRGNTGSYFVAADLGALNTAFNLNLVSSDSTTYTCNDASPPTECIAMSKNSGADFTVTATLANNISSGNPACPNSYDGCP